MGSRFYPMNRVEEFPSNCFNDQKSIHIWGIKQNNLKNIDVKIPLGKITTICGPSGSGKSSLAFETLFAEGQRRYIESLSNYTRQFLDKAAKPDIEGISNIPPAIAIEQKNRIKTSRSTVGTITEVIDYLRLLFEKIGVPCCPQHKTPIKRESVSEGTQKVLTQMLDQRGYILCPVSAHGRVATEKKLLSLFIKDGFLRILKNYGSLKNPLGEIVEFNSQEIEEEGLPQEDFYLIIDRMVFSKSDESRLADSLAQAYQASIRYSTIGGEGRAAILSTDGKVIYLSEEFSCSICGFAFPPLRSQLFNFNSPLGACETCKGFGNVLLLDETKVVPNPKLSIYQDAIHPLKMPSSTHEKKELLTFCRKSRIDIHRPYEELSFEQKEMIWKGGRGFFGINGFFEYLETKKYKMHVRVFISRYKSGFECSECRGIRIKKITNYIFINGFSISDYSNMPIHKLYENIGKINLSPMQNEMCGEILKQIKERLKFILEVGIDYLTLHRQAKTLSGGEFQRLNLANQLGSGLSQTLYVLDEPTVGLHPRDSNRLIQILKQLRDQDNTLVVVEHDQEVILNSEYILELGPGSGELGGEIVFDGSKDKFLEEENSNTTPYLLKNQILIREFPRPVEWDLYRYTLEMKGCEGHNLKNIDISIPLNRFVVVTGVSGSGKSTLVSHTLYPAIARYLGVDYKKGAPFREMVGAEHIKAVMLIDQSPIGKTTRSHLVTFLKIYDSIRNIMAQTIESKLYGFTAGSYSLNIEGGRCPRCRGMGFEVVDMVFMDDVQIICEECEGKGFKKEILSVTFKNKNIWEILQMTVREAIDFFVAFPAIRRPLAFLREVGLDYLKLGQSSSSLSGGESQRLKIAREFLETQKKQTLYILDEPTTGLHFREVRLLLGLLHRLIEAGCHVIVIEHNLEVIRNADYVIDLGPEGGEKGGEIVAQGSPEEMRALNKGYTSQFLKKYCET